MEELSLHLTNSFSFKKDEIQTVASYFKKEIIKKGEYFLKEGQYCRNVAYVADGSFIYFQNKEEEEKVCDFAFENEWISQFKSLINNIPSEMNIKALEDSILYKISSDNLKHLAEIVPNIIKFQANLTQEFFINSTERALNLSSLSAKERYVKEIEKNPKLAQRVPQYYLASYLGIKPQSLSRIRAEIM